MSVSFNNLVLITIFPRNNITCDVATYLTNAISKCNALESLHLLIDKFFILLFLSYKNL